MTSHFKINERDRKNISNLVIRMQRKAELFLCHGSVSLRNLDNDFCSEFDWNKSRIGIINSYRNLIWQAGLYSQGRKWDKNKHKWLINRKNGKTVTWTMDSKHSKRKAFDIAIFIGQTPYWPDPKEPQNKEVWLILHHIAHNAGLKTIGLKDASHFEI